MVGEAAHISAASPGPGGRRYNPRMSTDERRSFSNAIWLCRHHSGLIDRDDVTYTVGELQRMKKDHENEITTRVSGVGFGDQPPIHNLVALGRGVIATGEITRVEGTRWTVRLDHFVEGDIASVTDMSERFMDYPESRRYVLANSMGEGRIIISPPTWEKEADSYFVSIDIEPPFPRTDVHDLPSDIHIISADGQSTLTRDGGIGMVSGIESLYQRISLNLWKHEGDSIDTEYGSRIAELYPLYSGSPWLDRIIQLEAIRLASIPYTDRFDGYRYTPFMCVETVVSVEVIGDEVVDRFIPVRLELMVSGQGKYTLETRLFI